MTGSVRNRSRVPGGRLERLGRIGVMAGGALIGGAAESIRRLVVPSSELASVFLTGANATRLAAQLASMRGAAMKVGQLLSLEGEDFLPREVAQAFAMLRADADAMPDAQLEQVLVEAYGPGWRELFESFDPEPIAAASIGQVHRARSREGRELALKVQYPGVRESIDSDIDNLAAALKLARILPGGFDFSDWIALAKQQLRDESDYEREARCLEAYGGLMGNDSEWEVPGVDFDLTRPTVLAMDYLDGIPLEELCGSRHSQADRDRMGTLLLRLLMTELFEVQFVQSDPNFANFLLMPGGGLGLVDLGAGRPVPDSLSRGYALICKASLEGDRAGLQHAAEALGILASGAPPRWVEAVTEILEMVGEPFRAQGAYDFGATNLPERAREAGLKLAFESNMGGLPPGELLFLQRKLGGIFLLCARLGARVDVRKLAEPFVSGVLRGSNT